MDDSLACLQENQSFVPDEELVSLAQRGDSGAWSVLFTRYLPMVRRRASEVRAVGMEMDDWTQEGLIGLLQAIRSYRTNRDTCFKTYALTCIRNRIVSAAASSGREKHRPLNTSLPLEGELPEGMLADPGADPEQLWIRREQLQDLQQRIACSLSSLEQQVFSLYIRGYSYDRIAERLAISKKAVDNALQRIRKKLKTGSSDPDNRVQA